MTDVQNKNEKQAHDELKRYAALELTSHDPVVSWGKGKRSRHYASCVKKFSSYSVETLQRIIDVSGTSEGFSLYLSVTEDDSSEELVNDWCVLNPIIMEHGLRKFEVLFLLNALPYYEHLVPQGNGAYPDARSAQITAVTRVALHLGKNRTPAMGVSKNCVPTVGPKGEKILIVADKSLRNVITTSDDPLCVADIIIERNIVNVDQIKEIMRTLGHTPGSLRNGSL